MLGEVYLHYVKEDIEQKQYRIYLMENDPLGFPRCLIRAEVNGKTEWVWRPARHFITPEEFFGD